MTAVSLSALETKLSSATAEVAELIDRFADDVPSAHAVVLIDQHGLPLLWTGTLPEETADHFAALMLGLNCLANSAAQCFAGHRSERQMVELDAEYMFIERAGERGVLGVVADKRADVGAVGYEAALLAARVGTRLDEEVVAELAGRISRP